MVYLNLNEIIRDFLLYFWFHMHTPLVSALLFYLCPSMVPSLSYTTANKCYRAHTSA